MMKFKGIVISLIIILSLLPFYALVKKIKSLIDPHSSFGRLLSYIFIVLLLVFAYTFLIATAVRLVFKVS